MSGWNRWSGATARKTRVRLEQGWAFTQVFTLPVRVPVPPGTAEPHRSPEPSCPACSAPITAIVLINHSGGARSSPGPPLPRTSQVPARSSIPL